MIHGPRLGEPSSGVLFLCRTPPRSLILLHPYPLHSSILFAVAGEGGPWQCFPPVKDIGQSLLWPHQPVSS